MVMARLSFPAWRASLLVVTLAAWTQTASATFPKVNRIRHLSVAGQQLWLEQPDGSSTVLDFATGEVLARGHPTRIGTPAQEVVCEQGRSVCFLPEGVLTITGEGGPAVLELQSKEKLWRSFSRISRGRLWAATGRLLLESVNFPLSGVSTLECIDSQTGTALWLYAYPSPDLSVGFRWYKTQLIAEIREILESLHEAASQGGPIGTVMMEAGDDTSTLWTSPYQAPIRLDPDPLRARWVNTLLVFSWALLVSGVAFAVALSVRLRPSLRRDWLIVALCFLLGALIQLAGVLDDVLLAATMLGFATAWFLARDRIDATGPRFALLIVLLITTGLYLLPRFLARIQR